MDNDLDLVAALWRGDAATAYRIFASELTREEVPGFPNLKERDIAELLVTRPPTLSFLSSNELHEIRVAAILVVLRGSRWSPQKHFSPGFEWNHPLIPRLAVRHIHTWWNWKRHLKSLEGIRSPVVFRLSHSCDPGTCEVCTEAGRYLYSVESVPDFPIAGCSNLKDGCRCSWSSYVVKNRAELEKLLEKFSLKLHPSDNIAE